MKASGTLLTHRLVNKESTFYVHFLLSVNAFFCLLLKACMSYLFLIQGRLVCGGDRVYRTLEPFGSSVQYTRYTSPMSTVPWIRCLTPTCSIGIHFKVFSFLVFLQVSFDVAWSPNCIDKRCYDYVTIAESCDLLFVMSYDEQSQIPGDCIAMANAPVAQTIKGMLSHMLFVCAFSCWSQISCRSNW